MDLCVTTFQYLKLFLLVHILSDKMQWLLKMSSIYEEIRTKHFDKFLLNSAKSLLYYSKFTSIIVIITGNIGFVSLSYNKWDQFIDYPIGSLFVLIISIQFEIYFDFKFVIRHIFIIIFICRMHCFLFKSHNKYFNQLSEKRRKRNLKTYLSIHYKLCESVEVFQTFLRPMFVTITMSWCTMVCSGLYFILLNKQVENNYVMISANATLLTFFILTLILSSIIAMIDIDVKRGLHAVYGCALKLPNKQAIFQGS